MTALVVTALFAVVSVSPLLSGRRAAERVRSDDLALQRVLDLRATLADWQVFIEPQLARASSVALVVDPVQIAQGTQLAVTEIAQAKLAVATLRTLDRGGDASSVETASLLLTKSLVSVGALAAGRSAAVIASTVAAERSAFAQARAVTGAAVAGLRQSSDIDSRSSIALLGRGRMTLLIVDAIVAVFLLGGGVVLGQSGRRREVGERADARLQQFEKTLQRALEMAKTETDSYVIVDAAVDLAVPHLRVDLLVADSSLLPFHEKLHVGAGIEPSCGVGSPRACPAIDVGHLLEFPTSRALDACPFLKHRASGECSAVCMPVSLAGSTVGVLHATGQDGVGASASDVEYLEITARRSSERLAMLRAFARSETRAGTDPLTGLWNRRSLEARARDLEAEGTPFSVAYGDLDHFKAVNDAFGHDAGDRALVLFSRILRECVRPDDLTARYGGEEFVVVFPGCSTAGVVRILDRLRGELALSMSAGGTPVFTVSFGVASSADADTFDDVVIAADHALLTAKAEGRNRSVIAGRAGAVPVMMEARST